MILMSFPNVRSNNNNNNDNDNDNTCESTKKSSSSKSDFCRVVVVSRPSPFFSANERRRDKVYIKRCIHLGF